MTLDIIPMAQEVAPSLALLAPCWRGLLALCVCAAVAWAVGLWLTVVDWVEKRDDVGGAGERVMSSKGPCTGQNHGLFNRSCANHKDHKPPPCPARKEINESKA